MAENDEEQWQLSSSDSSSNSTSNIPEPAVVRRPAHRPRTYPVGSTRADRRLLKKEREAAEVTSAVVEQPSVVEQPAGRRIGLLRPVGGGKSS